MHSAPHHAQLAALFPRAPPASSRSPTTVCSTTSARLPTTATPRGAPSIRPTRRGGVTAFATARRLLLLLRRHRLLVEAEAVHLMALAGRTFILILGTAALVIFSANFSAEALRVVDLVDRSVATMLKLESHLISKKLSSG